jgi:hypothetical protein
MAYSVFHTLTSAIKPRFELPIASPLCVSPTYLGWIKDGLGLSELTSQT